jgi:hypothetical protein
MSIILHILWDLFGIIIGISLGKHWNSIGMFSWQLAAGACCIPQGFRDTSTANRRAQGVRVLVEITVAFPPHTDE